MGYLMILRRKTHAWGTICHPRLATSRDREELHSYMQNSSLQAQFLFLKFCLSAGRDLNPRLYGFAGRSLGPLGHRRTGNGPL